MNPFLANKRMRVRKQAHIFTHVQVRDGVVIAVIESSADSASYSYYVKPPWLTVNEDY